MKNVLRFAALVLVLTAFNSDLSAQGNCFLDSDGKYYNLDGTPCTNTVATAVPFLRIVADARSGAMGDVGIGLSADPNAMHFNASKLVLAEEDLAVSATYTPWLRSLGLNDVYLAYLTGYKKLDDLQALGFGLRYFSLGSIQFTDVNGEPLVTGRPNEFEVALAYSRKLSDNFTAGLTGKFIYSNLAAGQQLDGGDVIEAGIAGAADVSFTYQKDLSSSSLEDSELTIGLALTNIGSKITYTRNIDRDFLPANFGMGAAWVMAFDDFNTLTIAADVNKLMVPTPCQGPDCATDTRNQQSPVSAMFSSFSDAPEGFSEEIKEFVYSVGLEYWYDQQFAVRAGYFNEHIQKGGRKYLTLGMGLKYNIFGLNFSYLVPTTNQRNPLDNTLRFSLLFDFGAFEPGS
ncbi:type IX secretion system outer membrane channel protein PorV [Lewinella sp. LCG006]|uniref:type IX secretion system outer membrane channel protein PorV n=1 Tax=Lewinella sp. LCG006 TaxID=3231911 RepID=UPI003460F0CB